MKTNLRAVGAIVVGVITAFVVITLAELFVSRIYPMPAGVTAGNSAAMREWISHLPAGAFLLVLCGWVLGALAAGFVSAKIERPASARRAAIIGGALLAASVLNMLRIPHPIWMWVGAIALIVPAALLGARVASGPTVAGGIPAAAA